MSRVGVELSEARLPIRAELRSQADYPRPGSPSGPVAKAPHDVYRIALQNSTALRLPAQYRHLVQELWSPIHPNDPTTDAITL
jgi:hypothetical protein